MFFVVCTVVLPAALGWLFLRRMLCKRPAQPLRVESLHIYPVKSCQGIAVQEWPVDAFGLEHDRRFVVYSTRTKAIVTQRERRKLATVKPRLDGDYLCLSSCHMQQRGELRVALRGGGGAAVGNERKGQQGGDEGEEINVEVWRSFLPARSTGKEASQWFSELLRSGSQKREEKQEGGENEEEETNEYLLLRFNPLKPRDITTDTKWGECYEAQDRVAFPDGSHFQLACLTSLDDLNHRLRKTSKHPVHIPMNRFRPNIVVSGGYKWQEDTWSHVDIGESKHNLRRSKHCHRCIMPTIDQETGKDTKGLEPLRTLRTFRLGTMVSQHLANAPKDNHAELAERYEAAPLFGLNMQAQDAPRLKIHGPGQASHTASTCTTMVVLRVGDAVTPTLHTVYI